MSCPRTSWSWARCSAASTSASAGQCTNRSVRSGSAMRSRWLNRGGRCQPGDTARVPSTLAHLTSAWLIGRCAPKHLRQLR